MAKKLEIPLACPMTGEPLHITELQNKSGTVTIRGEFAVPKTVQLSEEHQKFMEAFLRARGILSTLEQELNLSYPTVRARLDDLLEAMELTPFKESKKDAAASRKVLDELEKGTITAEEAKDRLKKATK